MDERIKVKLLVANGVWGTSRMVPGSIPGGVTGFFSDISFRPFHGPGIDSGPSDNEYQEHSWG
jgi:hypothetical protein